MKARSEEDSSKTTDNGLVIGKISTLGTNADTSSKILPNLKEIPSSIALNLKTLSEIWKTVYEDIQHRGTTPKYPIGLTELDNLLWGFHKKELLTIGARTSHGKSALALQIAFALSSLGQRVVYFSLEMSREQLVERLLANYCKIDNRWIRHGIGKDMVDQKKHVFEKLIKNLKLLIDDKYGFTYDHIVNVCKVIKPDFIFIDYIQMVSRRGFRSKLDAIEENVRLLKELANTYNFGVVLVSQINRAGEEGMTMANLKGAGVLEEHSDTVMLLDWRPVKNIYKCWVAKQRHGEVGNVQLQFVPEYFRFSDYSPTPTTRKDLV